MGDASVALLPINSDGSLALASGTYDHVYPGSMVVPSRQAQSHAHCIVTSSDNGFALACDPGLDKIMMYRFDHQNKKLVPHDTPSYDTQPGSGPRHLTFHPSLSVVYVAGELNSTIGVWAFDAENGTLSHQQTISTIEATYTDFNAPADIHVHPDGQYLYVSNCGHDSIAIYAIHQTTGLLTLPGFQSTDGKAPRNFAIAPMGNILLVANQDSHNITSFKIDRQTGGLTQVSTIGCPTPVCLKIITLSDK